MAFGRAAAAAKSAAFRSVPILHPIVFLLVAAVLLLLGAPPASSATFRCAGGQQQPRSCESLVGFPTPANATYTSLKSLFGIKSVRRLFAANNLPPTTDPTRPIPTLTTLRIPFPCSCSNGTGTSAGRPVYTVRKGEPTLDVVARSVFGGFVDARELAAANGIRDPTGKVDAGKKLRVPLPCSCDAVDGVDVVHYAHKVVAGSTVEGIADEFGTKVETLTAVNGIEDPRSVQAEQILDVPLRVCSSSVRNDSLDSPLLVPNNSYVLTAGNCVQCGCSAASTWRLQCTAIQAQGLKTKWPVCPPATCPNTTLSLGNASTPAGPSLCDDATLCAYAGYTKAGILTTLTPTSVCPAQQGGSSPTATSQGDSASGSGLAELGMTILLAFNLVYFGLV